MSSWVRGLRAVLIFTQASGFETIACVPHKAAQLKDGEVNRGVRSQYTVGESIGISSPETSLI